MPDGEKIYKSLIAHNINKQLTDEIMQGYELITKESTKEEKATFALKAVERIDKLLDEETKKEVIDWCACCKTGEREKNIKNFKKENNGKSLAEKIEALNNVRYMGEPELLEDGTITANITWLENGSYKCACWVFDKIKITEPFSKTYCQCCAGHYRYHYQKAFGKKLMTKEIVSTAVNSLGKSPCRFIYEISEK